MQLDCALRIASRGRLTSFSVEYKAGNQSLFECTGSFTKEELRTPSTDQTSKRPPHHKKCTRAANCFIGRHPGTGSTLSSLGTPVSSRTVRRRLAEGHLGSQRPLRVLCLTTTHRRLRLEWCRARGNWTAAE
ncbi:uncharacterized protein TNCV_2632561 [Trichonephila clavipes]|nr:uncharacterized protein TNCV_2632561 [Trichonephila clavipes]